MIIFFPYLGFLAHQVMEIVGSQIKVEWMFNMARVIIGLKQCQLGIENLDNIVLITKIGTRTQDQVALLVISSKQLRSIWMLKTTYLKKMKYWLQILIFLKCELDKPWNIKLRLTTMKVKQEEFLSYLLIFLLPYFWFTKWTS